jgi:hypothetical protein
MAGRMVVGLSKVSSFPEDEILDGKGCIGLPSSSSSLSMMVTAAIEVNAYLHRGTVLLPHCRIHNSALLRLP